MKEMSRERSTSAWREERRQNPETKPRVAVISLHTSPLDQPGTGDSGGMNVYIMAVVERLAEQGVAVDIYTRREDASAPAVEELAPGRRLIQVHAGPTEPIPKEDLPGHLPEFLDGVLRRAATEQDAHL